MNDAVVAAYEYEGFGQITQTQGTLVQPYGYTGREYDSETGLRFYRARYFDSSEGKFLQSDPLGFGGGDENLFSYSYENPFNFADPNGLSSIGYTSKISTDDKKRKGVLPKINYGIGSVLGTIGEMLGYVANAPLSQQPPNIREYHPGAGSRASDLGENDPRCVAAKSRVKQAKARVEALGRACVQAKDYTNVLRMRANMEEGVARTQRDIVCPMDALDILSKGATRVGELVQKMDAFGHMNRYRTIISLYGR